jgi:hypothetical protein
MTAAVDCSQVGAGVLRDRPWWGGPKPPQAASVKSRGGERCGKGVYRPGVREVVAAAFGCFNPKAVVPGGAAGWQIAEPEGDPAGSGAGRDRNAAAGTRWTAGQLGSGHRAVAPHRGRGALRRRGGGPHFGSGLTIRHRGREVQGEGLTMHRLRPRPAIAHAASPPCCIHLPHPNRTVDRHISTRRATFDFRHESALERTWIRATERLICAARGSSVSLVSPNLTTDPARRNGRSLRHGRTLTHPGSGR